MSNLSYELYLEAKKDLDRIRKELEVLKSTRCDECGTKLSSYIGGCPFCGAPECCQSCCKIDHYSKELEARR